MTQPTRVQQVSEELDMLIGELQALARDGKIGLVGRREMFNRLRPLCDRLRRLLSLVGSM